MNYLAKILIYSSAIALLHLLTSSCEFGLGKKGNGQVVRETRPVTANFREIKASEGLDVYITQAIDYEIVVEADENLQNLIQTEIKDGRLHIYRDKPVVWAKSKKIYISLPTIEQLIGNSGAEIQGDGLIRAKDLNLDVSSGASIKIEVEAEKVHTNASSGADIDISGNADYLKAEASSGAGINADKLRAKKCEASASSGGDIYVDASDELLAKTSGGGDIHYKSHLEKLIKNKN